MSRKSSVLRRLVLASLLGVAPATLPAMAQAPSASAGAELRAAFDQVMANPADVAANMRYGQAAEAAGQPRKALAAYERAAAHGDAEAMAAYERLKLVVEPATTRILVGFGVMFDSNADYQTRQLNSGTLITEQLGGGFDVNANASLRIIDERVIDGRRWRSRAQLFGDFHVRGRNRDGHYASIESGPMFAAWNGIMISPSLAGEVGFADYKYLFHSLGLAITAEMPHGYLKRLRVGFAGTQFAPSLAQRNGYSFSGKAEFAASDIAFTGDAAHLTPYAVRYRGSASSGEETYTEAGMRLAYVAPLGGPALGFSGIFVSPELTVSGRWYAGFEAASPVNLGARHDYRLIPGIRLIGSEFLGKAITAFVYYEYDRLRSNYVGHSHDDHRTGMQLVVEF
ncbi:MAG: hypothetical protein AB7O88_23160 [Reyranellaceae bacterium]